MGEQVYGNNNSSSRQRTHSRASARGVRGTDARHARGAGFWNARRTDAPALALLALLLSLLPLEACEKPPAPPSKAPPSPAAINAALQSAESYLAADKPQDAVQVATRLASEAPHLMRVHELLGRALVAQAMHVPAHAQQPWWDQAADAYRRAAALEPTLAGLQHATGVVCTTAGQHEAARTYYQAAFDLEPQNPQYVLYLGISYAQEEHFDRAAELIGMAEQLAPDQSEIKAALADLAVRRQDLAAARRHIADARALAPDSLPLRLADARIRRLDKHPEEALDLLLALDDHVQCEWGVAEEIALAHTALGDYATAARAMELSANAAPEDWRRAIGCAQAWQRAGNLSRAEGWLQAAYAAGAPEEAFIREP